jgi:hypothetical protein
MMSYRKLLCGSILSVLNAISILTDSPLTPISPLNWGFTVLFYRLDSVLNLGIGYLWCFYFAVSIFKVK